MEEQMKFSIGDITIENMLQNIFKTYSVKKKRKDIVAYYSSKLQIGLFGKDENGHQIYAKVPIDTTGLVLGDGQRFCSNCVDQECYEHLKAISNRNMWEHTDSLVW